MIEAVLDFCAYGTYLEDYYEGEKEKYFTDEEQEIIEEIVNQEIGRIGVSEFIRLNEEKLRESIRVILAQSKQ